MVAHCRRWIGSDRAMSRRQVLRGSAGLSAELAVLGFAGGSSVLPCCWGRCPRSGWVEKRRTMSAVTAAVGAYIGGARAAIPHRRRPSPTQNRKVRSTDVNEQPANRPTKQVIVIRRDLRMRRGKEITQGAHAASAWLAELVIHQLSSDGPADPARLSEAERAWLQTSFRKVTVKVGSEAELMAVYDQALEAGLAGPPHHRPGPDRVRRGAHPDVPGHRPGLRRPHRPGDRRPRAVLTRAARLGSADAA